MDQATIITRMDQDTAQLLRDLARATERSQAATIRWLIKEKSRTLLTKNKNSINGISNKSDRGERDT